MELLNSFINWLETSPLKKTFEWNTDVVDFHTGKEQRNSNWSEPKRHWYLNWDLLPKANRDKLLELFNRAGGKSRTFQYEDADDYEGTCHYTQVPYPITGVDTGNDTLTISGNYTTVFYVGASFEVKGSTGNNGNWIVEAVEYDEDADTTTVTVTGNITNATADGRMLPKNFQLFKEYYPAENEGWNENRQDIQPDTVTGSKTVTALVENTDFTVERSTGIVTFANNKAPEALDVVSYNSSFKTITVAGNLTSTWQIGDSIEVTDCAVPGNNKVYTITNITYSAPNTSIVVAQTVTGDATGSGYVCARFSLTFDFYFRVRFAEDILTDIMKHPDIYEAVNLEIVEVKPDV